MTQRARGARLWYFRTPGGCYVISPTKPGKGNFAMIDSGYRIGIEMILGTRKPRGLPALQPGACIPVTVSEVEKGKSDGE